MTHNGRAAGLKRNVDRSGAARTSNGAARSANVYIKVRGAGMSSGDAPVWLITPCSFPFCSLLLCLRALDWISSGQDFRGRVRTRRPHMRQLECEQL